jgi:hypothetical protein
LQERQRTTLRRRQRHRYQEIRLGRMYALSGNPRILALVWLCFLIIPNASMLSLFGSASKTAAGSGKPIPLNPRAFGVLTQWRTLFPGAQPEHFVFPHEKYGFATNDRNPCAYETIPTEPTHRWKVAWETARKARTSRAVSTACAIHLFRDLPNHSAPIRL